MTQKELLKLIASKLENTGIGYMITGAWSVIFHGRVRTSHDLDFIIELSPKNLLRFKKSLTRLGGDFSFQNIAIDEAVKKRDHFDVLYLPSMDKIDFWLLKNTEFDKSRFARRTPVDAWGQKMYLSSREDTIIQKLVWYDKSKIEKHLVDAAFVWQLHRSELDEEYVDYWTKNLNLTQYLPLLDKVKIEDYY